MTLVLLTLALGSCNAIKFAVMTDPARAIYLYKQMYRTMGNAQSYKVNTDMVLDRRLGEDVRKFEYRFESSLSNMGGEKMKYIEKDYETINGISQLQGVFGFSDGKMFISRKDNNMVSALSADEFIDFMNENSADDETSFNMSILNCGKSSYTETESGYKVSLSEFYDDAVPCLVARASNILGVNRGLLSFKSYLIEAEMNEDYVPIKETEVLEVEVIWGYEGKMRVKLTTSTEYSDINDAVTVDIPELATYRKITDIRPILLASNNCKAFMVGESGNFGYQQEIFAKKDSVTVKVTTNYDIEYGDKDGSFEYSVIGDIRRDFKTQALEERYKNGTLKYKITDNQQTQEHSDNILETIAKFEFTSIYLNLLQFDVSTVKEVEIADDSSDKQTVTIVADVYDEQLRQMFRINSENVLKTGEFIYVFVYDVNGELLSVELSGAAIDYQIEYELKCKFTFNN